MIGRVWKTVELLDTKQNSWLTTMAACAFCGAVMITVGGYRGRASVEATKPGEREIVKTFKPVTEFDDQYSDALGSFADAEDNTLRTGVDWELVKVTRRVLATRKVVAKHFPPNEESDRELRAAIGLLAAYADKLGDQIGEHEASPKESKDATPKDVGNSR